MLTRWLTFTALLAGSANPQRAATGRDTVSVAPTCRVKGHPQVQLTLNCGDGNNAGVVLYWHTPFGELQSQGFQSELDPVFVHRDGGLVIPDSSALHSGLYYCLLQHTGGTTLWPYELRVDQNRQKNRERDGYEQSSSCATVRFSGGVGPGGEKQAAAGVSQEEFAGAVAASVLLTFVLGFSAGALSRTRVLRCLRAVSKRLQSPWQQTDTVDCGSEVTMTTVPPMSQAFEMGQVQDDDSVNCASVDTTTSSPASSPPVKPQRSFRHKREEQLETAAYPGEEAGREGGGSQDETDGEECSEDREWKDGGLSREEEKERRQEEEEEADVQENETNEDGEQSRGSEEAAGGDKEKRRGDEKREGEGCRDEQEGDDVEEARREEDSQQSSTDTDDETGGKTQGGGGEAPPCPVRRSRVIRLYQYDEDGQRYCHLPDPAPNDPEPPPRARQRSVSLTRLNAIMAAATAGPLVRRETGRGEVTLSHGHITEGGQNNDNESE